MKEQIYQNIPACFHAQLMETLAQLPEEKRSGKSKTVRIRNVRRWLVPLAAVLALGTMTAAAAGIFKWHEAAKERFGISGELEDKLTMNGITRQENVVVKEDGMEFQLLQSVRADQCMYYLCQVTTPSGIMIDEDTLFEYSDINADVEVDGVVANFVRDSQNESQQLLEIEVLLSDGVDYEGQEATIHLSNLVQTDKTEVTEVLAEGEWAIPVTLRESEDHAILYEVKQQLELRDHMLMIDRVEVSPFELKLYMDEEAGRHALSFEQVAVKGIRNADGSITGENYYLNQAACKDDATGEFYYRVNLDQAVDPANAVGILFGRGGEISLKGDLPSDAESEADVQANAAQQTERGADVQKISDRYGHVVVTDGHKLYIQDITCGRVKELLNLEELSFDLGNGGEIVPFGAAMVYILPYEDSDVVYIYGLSEDEQGEHTLTETPAEKVLFSESYQLHRENMLKNQQERSD